MKTRQQLIKEHGSIKKACEADSPSAKLIRDRDSKAGLKGVRSRKHKNPMHGLAVIRFQPQFERHIQGERDNRKGRVMTRRMRIAGQTFKQPLTPPPFCK